MFKKPQTRSIHITLYAALSCLTLFAPSAPGQVIEGFPLIAKNFSQAAPRGFGDRNNSWPQAMIWWKNNLYVGTSRQSLCGSLYGVYLTAVGLAGKPFADAFLPYPPLDPNLSCAPDAADLDLQAEIWRWSPVTNGWTRVFQSLAVLDNPGSGGGDPPRVGKKLPYEIAFRGFTSHVDPDGTQALYAFGINSTILWDRSKLPPPRILRSTDGLTWTPVPQTPGTFFGDLPFNADHSSFRSPASYDGKLFTLSGPVFGQGYLIASANPALGDNAWFLAGPSDVLFYELAVFNGWLYIGGFDPTNGYAIFKTKAQGPPPYQLTPVVPPGAGLAVRPSKSVVSMQVHYGRLYVGTASQTEIIQINPDDTWDLVVGAPRMVDGQWKYPTSGLDAGFGHTLNDHAWQMDDPYNYMYVGTYNASTGSRFDPVNGPLLAPSMGAHLYRTPDSWYYSPITTNGFTNPADPKGGIYDYGVRTMSTTPYGMFLGLVNDYYGLSIFRATKASSPQVDSPFRLEVEPARNGTALLSWQAGIRAVSYRIFRAEINQILVRDDLSVEGWNGTFGNKIPDIYIGAYTQIGSTAELFFQDSTVDPNKRYMYYVVGQGSTGALSEPSSLGTFPLLSPPVTFARLQQEVDRWTSRGRFVATDPTGSAIRQQLATAKNFAAACQIPQAIAAINAKTAARTALAPESVDVEVLLNKLVRRLQLYSRFGGQVQTTEFCTGL
ncbi:MAG: hypothetical protein ABI759_02770 [Candidatus Solibacter sp.]